MTDPRLADLKPVYLIYGPEELLLTQAVERLKQRLAAVADLDYNLTVLDGDRTDGDSVITVCNTLPFMSERRLVIVRRADALPKDSLDVIARYAADPNPETVLVLVALKLAKNLRVYKAIDALGGVSEYKSPKKGEYAQRVLEFFAQRGKRIGLDAAEVLVRAVGYDLRHLSTEVDKVVAFAGDKETLSRRDVEHVVSTTAPPSVFDFTDALGARDVRAALRLLALLVDQGESVHGILALSVRHVRHMLSVHAIKARSPSGSPVGEIMREVGVANWQANKLLRQAGRYSGPELVDALRGAARTDAEMKTSRDARLVFERWIVDLCRD